MRKLFMIDGAALFYRSYFAFIRNPLINSKGENTSAPYGFANAVVRLLEEEKPDYLVVVFDTPEPTFRHKLYPDYKATREKMPDEMRDQFPRIVEFLNYMQIPILEMTGYEADDIMGTIAEKEHCNDLEINLFTGDKDFMQLIKPNIYLYSQGKGGEAPQRIGKEGVEAKFGCRPDQVIDVLGLMGDASDNVPGVPKIGAKTAARLIAEFGSIQGIYDNMDAVKKSKMKENLIEFKDQAFLSRQLVTIDTNVPVAYAIDDFIPKPVDLNRVTGWFKEMEFNSLQRRVAALDFSTEATDTNGYSAETAKYHLVDNSAALQAFDAEIRRSGIISFDTETTGLSIQDDTLIGASFCGEPGEAFYINVNPEQVTAEFRREALQTIGAILGDKSIAKTAQNGKFDIQVLRREGITVENLYFDTLLAAYLLDSNANHNMDALAQTYLNYKTISFNDLTEGKKADKNPANVPIEKLAIYAAEDADITLQLYETLQPKIMAEKLKPLLFSLEQPLALVLADMESYGVKLDVAFLEQYSKDLEGSLDNLRQKLYAEAGKEFNLNSPSQLGPILFEELEVHKTTGAKRIPKTKTGQYSTAENVLLRFEDHPFVASIMEYRKLTKLKSTYVDVLPKLVSPTSGYLHTSFNQTVAATGRLSSSDPNLQNIPIRTAEGKRIRTAFIARAQDRVIVSADYSQIELRVMAALSEDANMIAAFRNNEDIHRSTAAKVFGVAMADVDSDMRRKAKEVNFGIIYGISQYGLARRLGISNAEAEDFIASYFSIYPKVQEFMAAAIAEATDQGYVTTILNRKRYIPELQSSNRQTFENGQRMAINSRIQGSAADLIKKAMIDIHRAIKAENLDALMILQVHDELVFDVAAKDREALSALIINKMENAIALDVPIKAEVGYGANWLEAH
jgi:DNA polymerase-1